MLRYVHIRTSIASGWEINIIYCPQTYGHEHAVPAVVYTYYIDINKQVGREDQKKKSGRAPIKVRQREREND